MQQLKWIMIMIMIMMISVLVVLVMFGNFLVQSVYASSSTAESERINDEILTFDVDCQEGYELDDSGSTCIPSS